jgi:hypothetical protein
MLQFWNILYFGCKKTSDNQTFIVKRHDIRSLRVKHLRAIRAYSEEGRLIVYVDKTYMHNSYTTSYAWDDGSRAGLRLLFPKDDVTLSPMLIIAH